MLSGFGRKQEVYKIAGVPVGGQPWENPTVLVGTIFYEGHKIVSNPEQGLFDRVKAEELLLKQEKLSEATGNPCFVEVVGRTGRAFHNYIDFVAEVTRAPILVDSPSVEARIEGCRHAVEIGLRDRIIYNSINPEISEKEIDLIREIKLDTAIVLPFSGYEFSPEEKLRLLQGDTNQDGLLKKAERAGIKKVLVDTAVLDVVSTAYAVSSIRIIKEKLGLPSGCSPANSFDMWQKVKDYGKLSSKACLSSLCVFVRCFGADFILYGPIRMADVVFPACAMADAILTYSAVTQGYEPKDKNIPLYKIF
ncbi:MAG: tetrahydromethanopterin S-methyltransferase subunit H [Candidatus Freyarchaeota archaeon]